MEEISRDDAIKYLCGKYLVTTSPINGGKEKCEYHNGVIDKAISDMEKMEKIEHILNYDCTDDDAIECDKCEYYCYGGYCTEVRALNEIEQILKGDNDDNNN